LKNLKYITSVGAFLRKYSLDEFPQLWNVVKGDISFVGPRPALFNQDDLIELRTRKRVHELVPGITGWAQINGRDDIPIPLKVEYDEYYLKNKSFFFDLKIIFMTAIKCSRQRVFSIDFHGCHPYRGGAHPDLYTSI